MTSGCIAYSNLTLDCQTEEEWTAPTITVVDQGVSPSCQQDFPAVVDAIKFTLTFKIAVVDFFLKSSPESNLASRGKLHQDALLKLTFWMHQTRKYPCQRDLLPGHVQEGICIEVVAESSTECTYTFD